MENYNEDINEENQTLLNKPSNSLGGLRTLPFIIANEGFEKAAYIGIKPNMILYLIGSYGLDMSTASNIIFFWSAAANFTPILCAFLADAYVGRFPMIGFGTLATLMGMVLLWSTTTIPGISPSPTPSTLFQLIYLCFSLALMSIGSGGLRSSSLAFGADQLRSNKGDDENPTPGSSRALASLFNWYYFSVPTAILFALTCIVYIQDRLGWQVGFGVPVVLMLISAVSFFSASSLYVVKKPVSSVLSSPAQVIIAAWRNRGYTFSSDSMECVYYVANGSVYDAPTEKLRFLNKACIEPVHGHHPRQDDEHARDPWRVCSADQVEELKTMVKLIPLWSTAIIVSVTSTTMSPLLVLQAKSMDSQIFSFKIPPASFGTFALVTLMLWLVLYDHVIIPLASKLLNKPFSIHVITRAGLGQLLALLCLVVAGVVERARRARVTQMSALWLVPQMSLLGLAEGLTVIAQLELMYSEFPMNMSSISCNLHGVAMSIASLVASLIMSVVDSVSKQGGKDSWVCHDPNKGHYDYYYWILCGLSLVNCVYFLWCSRVFREGKSKKATVTSGVQS